MRTLLILLLIGAVGCCTEKKAFETLRQLDRVDFVLERDTIIYNSVQKDTILSPVPFWLRDTVTIEKEKLKVQVIRLKGDTLKIKGECKNDTVFTEKKILKISPPVKEEDNGLWLWLLIAALGAVSGFLAARRL